MTIVIDQFRYDYLQRYEKLFVKDGFKLLMDHGAFMTLARYNYIPTVTGPGHSAISSGTTPSVDGIIGDDWYDRQTGERMYCFEDTTVKTVGAEDNSGMSSPRNFIGSTFADQLRLSDNFKSKVVGISVKDRAAIPLAGKKPSGAYWFDPQSGNFVTSTYYTEKLPGWVKAFNDRKEAKGYLGKKWKRILPDRDYDISDIDAGHGEGHLPGEDKSTFPHTIRDLRGVPHEVRFGAFLASPFANQLTVDFAKAAVVAEKLGQGSHTDFLGISFSADDFVGHMFGPYSQEVEDLTLRLDRQLADFFDFLNKEVGLKNVVIVLTGDHGVAPNPEYSEFAGINARRLDGREFMNEMERKLEEKYGVGKYILDFDNGQFYFDFRTIDAKGIPHSAVENFVGREALKMRVGEFYYTRENLLKGEAPGLAGKLVLNGFNPWRSGDVVVVPKPFDFFAENATGTTHGSPWDYDTHVPILFYGSMIKPGKYSGPVYVTDIAPTLCSILGIEEPSGCTGRPMTGIIR